MDQIRIAQPPLSGGLPETLGWAFDAFEATRFAARNCEDRVPELFATFMMSAGAAVEGRNAVVDAPSFPLGRRAAPRSELPAGGATDVEQIADELTALTEVLAERLAQAAVVARSAGDRSACDNAAESAHRIRRLLARASNETAAR